MLLAVLAATSASVAQQSSVAKVGVYLLFPDGSLRGRSHEEAFANLVGEFSGKAEFHVNRGVPPSGIAARIARLETEQYTAMILTAPSYYNPAAQHVSVNKSPLYISVKADAPSPQGVSTFGIRMYEAYYLAGIMAGRMSESGLAGFVGMGPTVDAARNVNAFLLGMRSERSNAQVKAVFVDMMDRRKERTAADWLMNKELVDVIVSDTDSDEVPRLAAANGVWTIPVHISDELAEQISQHMLFRIEPNWAGIYRKEVNRALNGQKNRVFTWSGLREGVIEMKDFNPALPVSHIDAVTQAAQEISRGIRTPFDGPIEARGKKVIDLGQSLRDASLLRMNYFVRGVRVLKSS